MRLDDFIGKYDWLVRGIPTFDEVSYGLPRLIGSGYCEVDGKGPAMRVRATPRAMATRSVKAKTLGGVLSDVAGAVGAPPYGEPQHEDRRLGRLPGLDEATWDAAVRANAEAFDRALSGLVTTGCLIAIAAVVGFVSFVWSRLRRRRPG